MVCGDDPVADLGPTMSAMLAETAGRAPQGPPPPPIDPPAVGRALRQVALVVAVVSVSLVAGHHLAAALAPAIQAKKLSWVLGRGLGISAFLSLTALVGFGTWVRHPLRARVMWPSPQATLGAHASLGAATLALVAAHLTALALDPWAKIGWIGALVPWASAYRPTPVALGTIALWGIVLVGGTARMAGKHGRRRWLRVHRVAWAVWLSALLHGLTTGSDTMALRYLYGASAATVVGLWVAARLVPAPTRTRPAPTRADAQG